MLEGQKFICIFKTIYIISARFRHSNFNIKKGIVRLVYFLSFQYCYNVGILTNSLLVKVRGNINKEMAEKIKRKKGLESKPSNGQVASKFDREDRKKEKMVISFW